MREVLRTNDIVLQSIVVSLLKEAQIPTSVADEGISFAEGSIGAFPRRILVPEAFAEEALKIVADALSSTEAPPEAGD